MILVRIGCKRNLTYINNYLKTAFLCALSRQTHDWLCAEFHRRRSTYAVSQWMDACGGTPYMQESSSNISSCKQSISNQRCMMKHGYLLYVHDQSLTCRSQTLSRLNLGKPRFNINYSKTIWRLARSPHISPIAAPVWFSSAHDLA